MKSLRTFPRLFFVAFFGLILLPVCRGASLKPGENPVVKAITVQYVGAQSVSPERIKSKLSTKVGSRLSIYQLDEDIKALYSSGEISNARLLSNDVEGGVELIIVVECRPMFGGVTFEGNTVYPDRKLGRMIDHPTNRPIDETVLRQARHDIVALYRKRGHSEAEVSYQVAQANSKGYARVHFTISEKAPGRLRNVRFIGNSSFGADEIKEAMSQKERGVQTLFKGWGQTDASSIADDVDAIEQFYRGRGFFNAKVVNVEKVPVDNRLNDLVITIDEGKTHNISHIKIEGVNALSVEKELAPFLKTRAGNQFSAEDLQHDIDLILDHYRSKGYIDATVTPKIVNPTQN